MRHLWRLLILLGMLAAPVGAWAVEATLHNAATANGDGGNVSVADRGSVGLRVTGSGTFTVTFKGSTDGGTTFGNIYCTALASTTNVSSTTSTNQYTCPTGGLTHIQAPISGCSGCTVTVRANTSLASLGGAGGGGGGGTEFAEDAAHTDGDLGTQILCVRRDANTTLAGTTGDYAPCQVDANGNLKVAIIAGGGTGGTSLAEDAAHSSGENITPMGCRRIDTAATSAGASGDWATVDCDANGALRVRIDSTAVGANSQDDDGTVASGSTGDSVTISKEHRYDGTDWKRAGYDPCAGPKTFVSIDIVTATTTELINGAGASNYVYVCSLHLVTAGANNVALVEDDTDACASPTAGIAGGVTAAEGWNLAANTGVALGSGTGTVMKSAATNRYVCLITSGNVQLSGSFSYVAAP